MEVDEIERDSPPLGILPWQLFYIDTHSEELTKCTQVTEELVGYLVQYQVISDIQASYLLFGGSPVELIYGRDDPSLFDMDFFRPPTGSSNLDNNPFDSLQICLQKSGQLESSAILRKGSLLWGECFETPAGTLNFQTLSEAISCGKISILHQFLSETGSKLVELSGNNGVNLLHVAVGCGQVDIIRYLLTLGFKLTDKDDDDNKPVHYLGKWSSNIVQVTKLLLLRGQDLFSVNDSGGTVAHVLPSYLADPDIYDAWVDLIFQSGHGTLFESLDNQGWNPIFPALKRLDIHDTTLVKIFSRTGVNPNARHATKCSYLHCAVLCGRKINVVETIVRNGADLKTKGENGTGLLFWAVAGGNLDVVKFLIEQDRESVNEQSQLDNTPAHMIGYAPRHHVEMTQILLSSGANLMAMGCGSTVAHHWTGLKGCSTKSRRRRGQYKVWCDFIQSSGFDRMFQIRNRDSVFPCTVAVLGDENSSSSNSRAPEELSEITRLFGRVFQVRNHVRDRKRSQKGACGSPLAI